MILERLAQVLGFVVILMGTSLYNEIVKSCMPGVATSAAARAELEVGNPAQPRLASLRDADYIPSFSPALAFFWSCLAPLA